MLNTHVMKQLGWLPGTSGERMGSTAHGSGARVPCRAGEKGRRIRELTSVVQKRFAFPPDTVELYAEKVPNRGMCAVAQAESLRYKLLGGLAVRRCAVVVWHHWAGCRAACGSQHGVWARAQLAASGMDHGRVHGA